jgi:hypothetical protein
LEPRRKYRRRDHARGTRISRQQSQCVERRRRGPAAYGSHHQDYGSCYHHQLGGSTGCWHGAIPLANLPA